MSFRTTSGILCLWCFLVSVVVGSFHRHSSQGTTPHQECVACFWQAHYVADSIPAPDLPKPAPAVLSLVLSETILDLAAVARPENGRAPPSNRS